MRQLAVALPVQRSKRGPSQVEFRPTRPFLKWAGGKTQLLDKLRSCFPATFKRYHEPFLGGGAVFFALQPARTVLSDVNDDLIATYLAIRNNVEEVIAHLQNHKVSEEYFYRVRALNSARLDQVESAARTIFLNRTCFNGLYRVNRQGQFNVPYGKYANPTVCNVQNLRAASAALQNAEVLCQSAFEISARVRRGDLVYFDPPYDPVSASASFTAYAKGAFGRDEQVRLAELYTRLANRGVHVVLSNSDTPLIRQLYQKFHVETVHARRAINSRADRRGAVAEVIVTVQ